MGTATRDRTDDIRVLEELWSAPTVPEPARRRVRPRELPLVPGSLVAWGWAAFMVGVLGFQPEPEPGMVWAAWAIAASLAVFGFLLAAGMLAATGLFKTAFVLAGISGGLMIALAVNCRASEHHLGNWWLAELGAAITLTALATVGLAQRLRSSRQ